MKPTVNRISTPSVKMSDSESKIIIMTESNVGSQAFWIIITGETNESLGSERESMDATAKIKSCMCIDGSVHQQRRHHQESLPVSMCMDVVQTGRDVMA